AAAGARRVMRSAATGRAHRDALGDGCPYRRCRWRGGGRRPGQAVRTKDPGRRGAAHRTTCVRTRGRGRATTRGGGATTRGRAYATARTQTRGSTPTVGARAGAEARIPA